MVLRTTTKDENEPRRGLWSAKILYVCVEQCYCIALKS